MSKHFFKCSVLIETNDVYDSSCDETFDVVRNLDKQASKGLSSYEEITEEEYHSTYRILTEEGGM